MEQMSDKAFSELVSRRNNPNYAQVTGYINKDLAMRFKIACTASEISQTDAIEEAVALWLEKNDKTKTKKDEG